MPKHTHPKNSRENRLERFRAALDKEGISYKPEEIPLLYREFEELVEILLDFYEYRQTGEMPPEEGDRTEK